MSFEFFEGATTDSPTTPRVTVSKGGQLVLTTAAIAMLATAFTDVQVSPQ